MTLDMDLTSKKKNEIRVQSTPIISQEVKPKRKKRWGIFVILAIVVLLLGGAGYIVLKGLQLTEKMGLKINTNSLITNNKEPELKKDSTGKYTNFLIVGIDTRENSGGLNTDTMVVASYNYDTHNIVMLSIPRDLSVEIGEGSGWYNKINATYAYGENRKKGSGLEELQKAIEKLTNMEIQYYSMVNFEAFVGIIDAIGGVDVNVENSFTDYMYPLGTGYQTVSFKAGMQTMDGETALKYARSRHSSNNGEGSDFMRARRQQKVILAVKDKILSTSTLTSPKAIMGIISSVADNVKFSDFTISDIEAGLNIAKSFNDNGGHSYSFVLDPASGNGKLIGNLSSYAEDGTLLAYVIGPKLGLGKYTDIHEYIQLMLSDPAIYNEDANIYVYNTGLGYQEAYQKAQTLRTKYPYLNIIFGGTLYSDKQGSYIYSHEEGEFSTTVDTLAKDLTLENKTQPDFITTKLNGENVTILLGKEIQLEQ